MKRLLILLLLLAFLLPGCALNAPAGVADSQPPVQSQEPVESEPEETLEPEPEPVVESEPEPEPVVAHLMAAGDIMCHNTNLVDAYVDADGEYDFSHMMAAAKEQLAQADYALANLETVLNGGPEYTGYPTFGTPDALAYNIKDVGFDLLSTANNHTRDKGMNGIFRTLDVLDEVGLAHVGTYRTQEERDENSGIYVADVGGISVAFLCYTYGLNGFRIDEDMMYAVNLFNLDYYTTLANPDYDLLRADLEAARAMDTDLIAVIIHWGNEYKDAPNVHQTSMAQFLVEQGADLVLGGHPHVLEPYETITVTGWDGEERQGFVCYSLGNFISGQTDLETKTTVILDMELTKDPITGETALTGVSYVPYYMLYRKSAPAGERYQLLDIHRAMAEYEAGESVLIDKTSYGQLQAALEHCHEILGSGGDRMAADSALDMDR